MPSPISDNFLAQSFHWPLLDTEHLLPDYLGLFGSIRKEDVHTGIDLYCEIGTEVVAMCDGIVVGVENFTGKYVGNKVRTPDQYNDGDPNAQQPSPWWNDTDAVLIKSDIGGSVILYGELDTDIEIGTRVVAGQIIGKIKRSVLRFNKGRPMTMLHLEWHKPGAPYFSFGWEINRPKPEKLLDPEIILKLIDSNPKIFDLALYDGKHFIDKTAPSKSSEWWSVWKDNLAVLDHK